MKYIAAVLVLLACMACGSVQQEYDPFVFPGADPYLLVDNNGLEDVRVYLYPSGKRIGQCVSLQKCRLDLTRQDQESILLGHERIAYHRLADPDRYSRVMYRVQQPALTLLVGRYDSGSFLNVRQGRH